MRTYTCPNCATLCYVLPISCSSCGETGDLTWRITKIPPPPKPITVEYLSITGDLGKSHYIRREFSYPYIGRPLLKQLSSQYEYACHNQFKFRWEGDICYLSTGTGTKSLVAINMKEISGETELKQGDVICLMGAMTRRSALFLHVMYH